MKFHIGGEPFYSPSLLIKKRQFHLENYSSSRFNNKFICYTGGGIHSLYLILKNINFLKTDYCLLPSYLCPTILYPFKKLGINFRFYKVNSKLEIDLDYLKDAVNKNCKSIFFINYFGFGHSSETMNVLKEFKQQNIIIIEDASQSFFSDFNEIFGDYYFNSFRKFLPADGSLIISNDEIKLKSFKNSPGYTFYRSSGQFFRYLNYKTGIDFSDIFKNLFRKAEHNYYEYYPVSFHRFSKLVLEKSDFEKMIIKRREYAQYLINNFADFSFIKELPDNVTPLGYPVVCKERDVLKKHLIKEKIFCPVHWDLPCEVSGEDFNESIALSGNILTLPVSENINPDHFYRYISLVKKYIS